MIFYNQTSKLFDITYRKKDMVYILVIYIYISLKGAINSQLFKNKAVTKCLKCKKE